jgi:hypothetical protein
MVDHGLIMVLIVFGENSAWLAHFAFIPVGQIQLGFISIETV